MKKLALTCLFAAFIASLLQAQNLSITEEKAATEDKAEVMVWTAHLDQTPEGVEKSFAKFLKETYNFATDKRGKNVIIAEKVKLGEVSLLRGDLRALLTPEREGTALGLLFSPGYDIHCLRISHPLEYSKTMEVLKKFIKFHYNSFYSDQLKEAEAQVKDQKKKIANNEERIVKLRKEVFENEQKINAGDKRTRNLIERNGKIKIEITNLETENALLANEIAKVQTNISKQNEVLLRLANFQ